MNDKGAIIKLKQKGHSNRSIQSLTGTNRKTVAKYWAEHCECQELLAQGVMEHDLRELQERISGKPKYKTGFRPPRKYTAAVEASLETILESERMKDAGLGECHKQQLTGVQIHGILREEGHDLSLSTAYRYLGKKRERHKEAFIKQEYEYGQRLEYDFGEVKLVINGEPGVYHMSVFGSPASNFRWAYLYRSQDKEVFLDSHVRFFEMSGGCWHEVVYDNMRNVVSKFIGRNEKELNKDLVQMSIYYGFEPNVTNCFRGNEKGYVESSVKAIRKKAFAIRYTFDSLDEAEEYLRGRLEEMNSGSQFEEEQRRLLPYRPPLDLARISEHRVDKYSFIRVVNNFYSVPDYLVGKKVLVREYAREIAVYVGGSRICCHKKLAGFRQASVEIGHYLRTLARKPGALRNSSALKGEAELKAVYVAYFKGREREFIAILQASLDKGMDFAVSELRLSAGGSLALPLTMEDSIVSKTKSQMLALSALFGIGGTAHVN